MTKKEKADREQAILAELEKCRAGKSAIVSAITQRKQDIHAAKVKLLDLNCIAGTLKQELAAVRAIDATD